MENQKQHPKDQLIARLKESNNVLVTVSRSPSVDQLSAAIGLTLLLNELGKHATAVFSGEIPNTLEFLKPEETLEKNTDSLRDFIISLDKAKADKLRYKVEDKMVKIFITPYRTSLSQDDLVFGQGDFNVDVVVGLGVQQKEDLDEAITSNGRILHDATVATVNTVMSGQLGSINWIDPKASSLSEMLFTVCEALKADALDSQMATAFLTGIVAETERFSNDKTSSATMNTSAKLMAAGANQQLVATKLEQPPEPPATSQSDNSEQGQAEAAVEEALDQDGSLAIDHAADEEQASSPEEISDLPEVQPDHQEETQGSGEPDQQNNSDNNDSDSAGSGGSRLILQPPTLGGTLTANSRPEDLDPSTDPMTVPTDDTPLLSHDTPDDKEPKDILAPLDTPKGPAPEAPPEEAMLVEDVPFDPFAQAKAPEATPAVPAEPVPQPPQEPVDDQTLTDLESAVDSPHLADSAPEPSKPPEGLPDADAALAAAHEAFDVAESSLPEKPAAFNSTGLMEVAQDEPAAEEPTQPPENTPPAPPADVLIDPATGKLTYPSNLVSPTADLPADPTATTNNDPSAPPPVPPPMAMPPLQPPSDELHLPPPTQ